MDPMMQSQQTPGLPPPAATARRRSRLSAAAVFAAIAALTLAATADGGRAPRAQADARAAICTFTNPAYVGECTERTTIPAGATAEQACTVILDCLNDSRCDKVYCRATTVRSGWQLAKAEEVAAASR